MIVMGYYVQANCAERCLGDERIAARRGVVQNKVWSVQLALHRRR